MSDPSARLADDVVFVLVGPQHPGNVGAAARAMANMGLTRLVVVDPAPSFDPERMRWMAPGADRVLDRLRIVATLDEALQGVHRAVATTARHRRDGQRVHEPDALAAQILDEVPGHVTAVLFGREDTGLTREEAARCESLLRIPTGAHASLNLGQAVLLVAHRCFEAARAQGLRATGRKVGGAHGSTDTRSLQQSGGTHGLADVTTVEPAVVELCTLLNRVGFGRATSPEKVAVTLREALQRARLSRRQVHAIRGMVNRVEYALDHPDIDWRASKRQQAAKAAVAPFEAEE